MRMELILGWNMVLNRTLNCVDILAWADAGAISDPEDVCVHRLSWMAPPHVHHDVGSLSPDAWKRRERGTRGWHLAIEFIDQDAAEPDNVLGLIPIKPDRLNMPDQPVLAECKHFLWRVSDPEELFGCLVHALVGRLSAKRHSDNQGIGIDMVQFALWRRLVRVEASKDLFDCPVGQLGGHGAEHVPLVETKRKTSPRRQVQAARSGWEHRFSCGILDPT